jgi:hypothetical protein
MEAEEIADHLGTYRTKVRDTVDRARYEGDERAHQRKVRAAPVEHVSTNTLGIETETREIAVKDAVQSWDCRRPVTLKRVTTQVDVFRPMKMSIEARASGTIDRTADLMGDPPPERSALGRPVRPDEYASRGGEGRYRDHKTPLRLTSAVGIAARRGVTPAAAVARQERYQRGEPMYGQKRAVPKHFNEYAPFHGGKEG